jgi:outer membrane protein assembly factor BamC
MSSMKQLGFGIAGHCVAIVFLASLAGCSALESKKIDYKGSAKTKPLEVPPDLSSPSANPGFKVPEGSAAGAPATYSKLQQQATQPVAPQASTVLPTTEKARFERGGSQRWLVVSATPENLWPVVKEFWQESGFLIDTEKPQLGIMETDWSENRAKIPMGGLGGLINRALDFATSSPDRDKFRTRLERGVEPGTTEIYISHKGVTQVITSDRATSTTPIWTQRPSSPELEAEMLTWLSVRLGVPNQTEAKAMLKAVDKAPPQATVVPSATGNILTVNDTFDRTWRRVGLALDRVGFMVEDRNRADGTYFVRYQDPDAAAAKKSFLSKLAFWNSDDATKGPERYRVQIVGLGAAGPTEVRVLNKDGVPDNSSTAKRILNLLAEQLQ